VFHRQNLDGLIVRMLGLRTRKPDLGAWQRFVDRMSRASGTLEVGMCGKYVGLHDSYKSVTEAVQHAAAAAGVKVRIRWLESEELTRDTVAKRLAGLAGVIVPGGFGVRGIEGKLAAVRYCRETGLPFLGLCVGLHCAVSEVARNVCGLDGANSTEFNPRTAHPVIYLMPGQRARRRKGGTMRLGSWPCRIRKGTLAHRCYHRTDIAERHRHRYEVNNKYRAQLRRGGLLASGISPDGELVEIVELKGHRFFIASQFHPEFKSRPLRPHPLFLAFIRAGHELSRRRSRPRSGAAG
jgi:CTP synthase